ncbi:corticosteroid 11-beta-dehydrogenase isozyme 2 [Trichonephila clavata]|uniref:Corticosteroid 11-beta-dehydrogenase isozyme 2 n=1 Tax=Trichonephila clavata TaxID=2740835 RepID=A0A8X6LAF4_TRICU|nr:corticosteroid 11-beta-dehydrogenase isozyme 2 [Trichonephila clavata]
MTPALSGVFDVFNISAFFPSDTHKRSTHSRFTHCSLVRKNSLCPPDLENLFSFILPWSWNFCYSNIIDIFVGLLFATLFFPVTKKLFLNKKIKPDDKAVLITGCDHGFGHLLAKKLDCEGFYVYASCLYPSGPGATELKQKSSNRLKILGMDVTSDESVLKAVKFVEEDLKSISESFCYNNQH